MTPNIRLDPNTLSDVCCDSCGSKFFEPVVMFKVVPAVVSPTGRETFAPIEAYACLNCKHVNSIFLPKTLPDGTDGSENTPSNIIV